VLKGQFPSKRHLPSSKDHLNHGDHNLLLNCPFTRENILRAEDIIKAKQHVLPKSMCDK